MENYKFSHAGRQALVAAHAVRLYEQLHKPRYPREFRYCSWYDSFDVNKGLLELKKLNLFGNTNVGSGLTNLQCAFNLGGDQRILPISWWVTPPDSRYWELQSKNLYLTMYIGDKPVHSDTVYNLVHAPYPLTTVIPPRQSFHVELKTFPGLERYEPASDYFKVWFDCFQVREVA